jgi:hypothetical protein
LRQHNFVLYLTRLTRFLTAFKLTRWGNS